MKHTGGQVEDGAEAGLQSGGTATVDHHHLLNLIWKLVSQECTEGHAGVKETEQSRKCYAVVFYTGINKVLTLIFTHKNVQSEYSSSLHIF